MLKKLFVYGTLKRGFCRSGALRGQTFLGTASTEPRYRMYDCGTFPGLVEVDDGLGIQGEVYEIDEACFRHLDDVEGVDINLYRRGLVELEWPYPGEEVWAYFYCRDLSLLRDCGTVWR